MTDNMQITIDADRLTPDEVSELAEKYIFLSQPQRGSASDNDTYTSVLTITSSVVNNFTTVQCTYATGLVHRFDDDQIAYLEVVGTYIYSYIAIASYRLKSVCTLICCNTHTQKDTLVYVLCMKAQRR